MMIYAARRRTKAARDSARSFSRSVWYSSDLSDFLLSYTKHLKKQLQQSFRENNLFFTTEVK
jgi:hypothetical protein